MASKETTDDGKEAAKPTKGAMRHAPNMAPPHPRELFGKGSKGPKAPPKGRSFRHQGR